MWRKSAMWVVAIFAAAQGSCERGLQPPAPVGAGGVGSSGRGGRPGSINVAGTGGGPGSNPLDYCNVPRPATRLPPEVLVLLDASASMNDDVSNASCGVDGCGAASKWAQLVPALNQVVAQTDTSVNWGLKLFASDTMCTVDAAAEAPVAPGNAPNVAAGIAARTSNNGGVLNGSHHTPTRSAIDRASSYLLGLNTLNPKYIVLATDGVASCPASGAATDDDTAGAVSAVRDAFTAGIYTFVVGIAAAGVSANGVDAGGTLAMLAAAGRPRRSSPQH
jgi:hypothetical protein